MKFLLVHQNYPGQFKHLAPELVRRGHEVVAIPLRKQDNYSEHGVDVAPYQVTGRGSSKDIHPWLIDFETKIIRAENCFNHCVNLKAEGFTPDAIIGHTGWGETLFLKEVWPDVSLGAYCEFYYHAKDSDSDFDPEFEVSLGLAETCRVRLKNLNNILHDDLIDQGICPTAWQASTFPDGLRKRITVVHDGIDTTRLVPNRRASIATAKAGEISRGEEIVTFVSRNLEPYRGFHIFMRAVPAILAANPNARIIIVGEEGKGYGADPVGGGTWRQFLEAELSQTAPEMDWSRISFLGRVPYDLFIQILQVSAVHVYLTYPFVASWSLLEAMSVGAAVVASDTSPVQEFITHGETGLLTDFFDHADLSARVSELLVNPTLRDRLGGAARSHIIENYDLRTICLPKQVSWCESLLAE